jgi:hypothetical protein
MSSLLLNSGVFPYDRHSGTLISLIRHTGAKRLKEVTLPMLVKVSYA